MQQDWAAIMRSGVFNDNGAPLPGFEYAFVTLTAPSFGLVHSAPHRVSDKLVHCKCGVAHEYGDDIAGAALLPETYEYRGTLLFNQALGQLWNSTTTRWRRRFTSGLAYVAVTEAQRRQVMHKHVIVRWPAGQLDPLDLLEEAAKARTITWTGDLIGWGLQMDVQHVNPVSDPTDAARNVRYLSNSLGYALKEVNAATGRLTLAAQEMMRYASEDFQCKPTCRARLGEYCGENIHDTLAGSERVVSQSENWSFTGITRTKLRRQRTIYMQAMVEAGEAQARNKEGLSESELFMSRHARRWRKEVEQKRQQEARQRWADYQSETADDPAYYPRT